jgi:hypothetical protein
VFVSSRTFAIETDYSRGILAPNRDRARSSDGLWLLAQQKPGQGGCEAR